MTGMQCAFQGTLLQDATLHWTDSGMLALDLWLAVADQGGPDPWLEPVQVTLFGEEAEELAERLTAGTGVRVEGRLRLGG